MPLDGTLSRLQQLRDLIAMVDDHDYHQDCIRHCALGHAKKAGLYNFAPGPSIDAIAAAAALYFGLPGDGKHFFGGPGRGPNGRREFLDRVDAVLKEKMRVEV